MEDQQPASGDLTPAETAETPAEAAEAAETAETPAETPAETAETAETPAETAETAETGDTPAANSPRPPRTGSAVTIGAAAAAFVVAGGFAAGALEPYLTARAEVVTKLAIARTAAEAIDTLWTYTPDDMDKLPDRAARYLSGDFQDQYRKFVDAIVATNKQAQVTNTTEVVASAVESLNDSSASALVYTNTTSTTPKAAIPSMKYLSYRLQLKRQGTHWLVTKMTTVTSLDLTPKL